jgi:L-aminopeptidase/D-esterase-like protein
VSVPGAGNSITDVEGVLVGQHQRLGDGWATGTTVVLVSNGAVAAVDQRGGAPGTRETDLLDPSRMVQQVQAICLSGGSAYGLSAADGVMRWLAERDLGVRVGEQPHEVVPIVPAAVLFDLPLGDWGNRPDAEFGYAACEAAASGPIEQGCVGAGTGAQVGSLKGGIGTASVVVNGFTVGAVVALNELGEAVNLTTGLPWAVDHEVDGEFNLGAPGRSRVRLKPKRSSLNTTIGVVAVDAALSKAECQRIATVAHDGLARAVRPAHAMFDGDTVFALATGTRELEGGFRAVELDVLCEAAAQVFARAIVHAAIAAHTVSGVPAYADVWPEAFSRRGTTSATP